MPSRSLFQSWTCCLIPAVLALLFLNSCATLQAAKKAEERERQFLQHPEQLVEQLHLLSTSIHTLRGIADVDIDTPQDSFHARTALVLRTPGFLRLEALSPFGQTALVFTADAQYLSLYAPNEGKFYRGMASPATFSLLLGLPLDLSTTTRILHGGVPLGNPEPATLAVASPTSQQFRLQVYFSPARKALYQEIWIDKATLSPQRYLEYTPAGTLRLQIEYDRFQSIDNLYLPLLVTIQLPPEAVTAQIEWLRLRPNVEVPADTFRIEPPPGVSIIWLSPEAHLFSSPP
ncbi:MAG: DUF4292 domain-containing protein [Nitrospinota bacterium]|nr:MAG: DUF4292 domain-containing protein [Nitrospinota bacterium]